jgi:rhodanese-related sulfurtransferase
MPKAVFVELVTADQPDAPAYFTYDAVLNTKERPTLDDTLTRELKPLSVEGVIALQQGGLQIVDTRDFNEFAAVHLAGSLNIPLGGSYATTAGTLLNVDVPIVLIAEPGKEHESAMRLARVGFDHVAGYLDDGLSALADRSDLLASTERLSAPLAAERLASAAPPLLVDVRTPAERRNQYVDGSVSVPLSRLPARLSELPRNRPLLLHCAGGYRSSVAASLLQMHGYTLISEIAGGLAAWDAAGLPVVRPAATP